MKLDEQSFSVEFLHHHKSWSFKKCTDAEKAFTAAALQKLYTTRDWMDWDDAELPDSDMVHSPPPRKPAPSRTTHAVDASHMCISWMDSDDADLPDSDVRQPSQQVKSAPTTGRTYPNEPR